MTNLTNQYVEVAVDHSLNALTVKFLGFTPHEEFKKILEYEFEMIKTHQVRKCVVDLRLIPVYASGSKEFVKDIWFPTVKKLGVRFVAFIVPEATLGQMAMQKAHEAAQSLITLKVEHFKDTESAKSWLRTCA